MRQTKPCRLGQSICERLKKGDPWVFRDRLESPESDFEEGDWLRLLDPQGKTVATGVYNERGGVAVRVLRRGAGEVTLEWLRASFEKALKKRAPLLSETDAYRLINGESDGFPGVMLDIYAGAAVLQTYMPGADALGRYLARLARQRLALSGVVWKTPSKRLDDEQQPNRLLAGTNPYVVRFQEGPMQLAADLWRGQKSGTFLDLRGLRRYLREQNLRGQRVLNLFSYTGSAGLACCLAGAKEVINVDQAQASLDFGQRYHKHAAQRWVCADVFKWIGGLKSEKFDLIIVDPPSVAVTKKQVPRALSTYKRLYSAARKRLKKGGAIIGCCCTSRISHRQFEATLGQVLRPRRRRLSLPMELDHEPAFEAANYLKVLVFR